MGKFINKLRFYSLMGFKTEFNWILKLKPENGLDEAKLKVGSVYNFSKEEYRVYPVNLPIDLVNRDWEAVAKVLVTEFRNADGKTSGKYKVLKIYSGNEKEVLTNYWRETIQITKGKKITDFSDVKAT
jgi:hypothetical protein